jgi:hypothetical protein
MFVGACWHHIYGGKRHDDTWYFLDNMQNLFTYELTRPAIFLPALHPSHIMGNRVPLGCDLDFEFLVGIHNNTLLALGEIHRSRSIHFA